MALLAAPEGWPLRASRQTPISNFTNLTKKNEANTRKRSKLVGERRTREPVWRNSLSKNKTQTDTSCSAVGIRELQVISRCRVKKIIIKKKNELTRACELEENSLCTSTYSIQTPGTASAYWTRSVSWVRLLHAKVANPIASKKKKKHGGVFLR